MYGNAHSKGYPAYTFASVLKHLVENGIKPYIAVEKRISLETDIKEFMDNGTVTPKFVKSLANAHHEVEFYRVARQLGLEIIPFDPRESPYWEEGMHVDQEMFNMLDKKIFQKDPGATVIIWGGRYHTKDIERYDTKSVVLEGEEFVTYQSEGPSLGHLLRKRFGEKTLIITNESRELPWQKDTEIELYISPSEKGETEDLSFIHLADEEKQRKRGASSISKDKFGGIDLNSNNLNLQTQGQEININIPFDAQPMMNTPIDGFAPVIIQIVPANIPALLGVKEEEEEFEVSSLN